MADKHEKGKHAEATNADGNGAEAIAARKTLGDEAQVELGRSAGKTPQTRAYLDDVAQNLTGSGVLPELSIELGKDSENLSKKEYKALVHNLSKGDGFFSSDQGGELTQAWPQGQVISATLAEASVRNTPHGIDHTLAAEFRALGAYWDTHGQGPHGYTSDAHSRNNSKFYDDNDWIGIDDLQGSKVLNDPALLKKAEQLFKLTEYGWDAKASKDPGGELEKQDYGERSSVATAGGAQLALDLYSATGETNKEYLDFAKRAYSWMNEHMRNPQTGLYYDHIQGDGTVDKSQAAYNQGLMLGDATKLYQATGDKQYLHDAQSIASASITQYKKVSSYPAYVSILCKNLEYLNNIAPNPEYTEAINKFAGQIASETNAKTGMLNGDFGANTLIDQAAATQIEALDAEANGA